MPDVNFLVLSWSSYAPFSLSFKNANSVLVAPSLTILSTASLWVWKLLPLETLLFKINESLLYVLFESIINLAITPIAVSLLSLGAGSFLNLIIVLIWSPLTAEKWSFSPLSL